jgi:hypothetical protein
MDHCHPNRRVETRNAIDQAKTFASDKASRWSWIGDIAYKGENSPVACGDQTLAMSLDRDVIDVQRDHFVEGFRQNRAVSTRIGTDVD